MLKKIISLYEDSIIFPERPNTPSDQYYIFYDENENDWVGILKQTLTEQELTLLKTLYELVDIPAQRYTGLTKTWYEFLLMNGDAPVQSPDTSFRFIHFQLKGEAVEQNEIEDALKGFFSDEVIIIWEDNKTGTIIEEKKLITLFESELTALSDTLESDFYVRIFFYIGKISPFTNELRNQLREEKEYFHFALKYLTGSKIVSFEKVFPTFVAINLDEALKHKVNKEIFKVFKEDPELYITIKVFLENNLNASSTAKKLYIHRNTLQYRIDKFVERSGISLKEFYGAFTVFLASLLFEQEERQTAQKIL